jgi:hypothetical protein
MSEERKEINIYAGGDSKESTGGVRVTESPSEVGPHRVIQGDVTLLVAQARAGYYLSLAGSCSRLAISIWDLCEVPRMPSGRSTRAPAGRRLGILVNFQRRIRMRLPSAIT